MFKPLRLVAVLLICAALLAATGSPLFQCIRSSRWRVLRHPWVRQRASAVLGGSTVTNTGPTIINGDLGSQPGTPQSLAFPRESSCLQARSTTADAVAAQAQSDVTTAYDALAGQACDFNLTGQDLGWTHPHAGRLLL